MSNLIFSYSSNGVDTSKKGNFEPVPDGEYTLEIMDVKAKTTSKGDPMIVAECEIRGPQYDGRKIWHNVTFFEDRKSPGAGMAIHFLHAIGQPYEGDFTVDGMSWIGATFLAKVVTEEYNGKKSNKVKFVIIPEEEKKEEEIPF